jgi:hypothetical protein
VAGYFQKTLRSPKSTSSISLMKMGAQVWIPCRISEGMFSNEYAVEIPLPSGEVLSLYVDKSLVRGSGDNGELLVSVVDSGLHEGEKTVLLPGESLQGPRWIRLPERDLASA